ncbi:inositol monophosphatase family protein [Nocardia amamiensis]|uniref:inositol monophosphatase family protein n=1 Tax=Nocardia amamiensis TaxID=404578 RepID=UPI00083797C4|nr:inositol monophosphatase family protein [Nocardia amamiensis]
MTGSSTIPDLAQRIAGVVRQMIGEIRPQLIEAALTGRRAENENLRHTDNFLSKYDLWMHQRYKEVLIEHIPSFFYASEEADPEVIGDEVEPDLCVLVDPLDTSELAVRGLYGYTHVMVYSRTLARPVAAVVGDIFHSIQIYLAARDDRCNDRAFMITADGDEHILENPSRAVLSEALVTNYMMRPEQRFQPLADQRKFISALSAPSPDGKARGRIGVDFGSIGLCHIAAGFSDAMIEFAKGFAIWDLSPGHYILHAAGGTVIDLRGAPIPLNYGLGSLSEIKSAMNRRQKFIAAGNPDLASEIRITLDV